MSNENQIIYNGHRTKKDLITGIIVEHAFAIVLAILGVISMFIPNFVPTQTTEAASMYFFMNGGSMEETVTMLSTGLSVAFFFLAGLFFLVAPIDAIIDIIAFLTRNIWITKTGVCFKKGASVQEYSFENITGLSANKAIIKIKVRIPTSDGKYKNKSIKYKCGKNKAGEFIAAYNQQAKPAKAN